MTNRELLTTPEEQLYELDKQRKFLLQVDGTEMPCPACKQRVNFFDAARLDWDAYDFGRTRHDCHCPHCQAELEQVIPFVLGVGHLWHWELKTTWLQDQLRKAKAFEQQNTPAQV
jgi:hypothetical protein